MAQMVCAFVGTFPSSVLKRGRALKYSVNVTFEGETKSYDLGGDKTILQALEVAGLTAPSSCCAGLCTECACLVTSGLENVELDAAILDPEVSAQGFVLTCSASIKGEGVELLLGQHENMYEAQYGDYRREHESYQDGGSSSQNRGGVLDGILNLNTEA
jgi:ferredoxin